MGLRSLVRSKLHFSNLTYFYKKNKNKNKNKTKKVSYRAIPVLEIPPATAPLNSFFAFFPNLKCQNGFSLLAPACDTTKTPDDPLSSSFYSSPCDSPASVNASLPLAELNRTSPGLPPGLAPGLAPGLLPGEPPGDGNMCVSV